MYSEHIRKCSKLQIVIVFPVLIPAQNFLFPGTGRENLKCHGKGRDGKFEACIPGNHGKREFPLTPATGPPPTETTMPPEKTEPPGTTKKPKTIEPPPPETTEPPGTAEKPEATEPPNGVGERSGSNNSCMHSRAVKSDFEFFKSMKSF